MTTLQVYKEEAHLMGNHFELSVVSDNQDWSHDCIKAGIKEIQRIEKKLTTFSNDSETAKINEMAGIKAVEVSLETIELIERSIKISQITQGAFDITYGSIDKKLWNFDDKMKALPDKETAKKMVRLINYRNIIIDKKESTVFLKEKGMRIGFGGIGKGYAAEMAKKVMRSMGVTSGIVNASGDLTTWGTQPDGKPWTIGIANPNAAHQVFSYLTLTDMAVATSGNYEKYIMIGGKKYSHTIHPKTGLPVTGIKSVTIITPNAEVADAMATPVTIMGIEAGLDMINQINSIEAIIIDDDNRMYRSKNINLT
jgi:thiamine biosynthesis lipoprotein